jgi:hypothetical protein
MGFSAMKTLNTRLVQRFTTIALSAVLAMSAALPASPAFAQEEVPPPSFSDGEWQAVIVATSRVDTPMGATTGSANGEAHFLVTDGLLEGTWTMVGAATMSGEASGSAEYVAEGNVTGSADYPQFPSTSTHIHMVIVIDGNPGEFSQDLPPGESAFSVVITSATCSQVIGEWEVSAAAMSGSGTFVATRIADLRSATAADFEARVTDLMTEAMDFRDASIASGRMAPGGLEALLSRAQELDRALTRARDCSATPMDGDYAFHNLLAGIVADLLQFALDNPLLLDSSEMRTLVTALLSTGAYGFISDDAITGLHGLVGANMDAAIASGNPIDISNMIAAAAMIGAWDIVDQGAAALGDE